MPKLRLGSFSGCAVCDESSQVCKSSNVSRSCEPNSGLACAEGRLRHAVLCEAQEEPFERPLPHLVADLCSTLFLQDCVAVNPQDVVDTADSRLSRRRANTVSGSWQKLDLAELDAFVHCSDDICLAQELVRDELPRPNSDSECDATVGNCRGSGQAPHVADSPLGWRCIQMIHVVDDFRLVGSAPLRLWRWRHRNPAKK